MVNDLLGKLIADKYLIESHIRESGSGDLYLGKHDVLGTPVIVQILSPALAIDARWVRRFVDEARSASALTDPNVLAVTDFGTDARGVSYAVFEAVDTQTLKDISANGPALDERRALIIASQIASAAAAAHSLKLIHGRLSPENIFISSDDGADTVKVYGFGADRMEVARDADPRYLAPEQCTPFPAADVRSDVYSLGVMLYEMLSGGVPFEGQTPAEVLAEQNEGLPPPVSSFRKDVQPDIEPILLSALAADPDKRYQTMSAFAEDLDTLSAKLGVPAKAAAARIGGKNIWQTAFIVLAGICVLAVAFIYATSVKRTDPTTEPMKADADSLPVQPIGPATGAQEESLAKLPEMTEAEIMATSEQMSMPDALPGGDGFNAWANGGAPPPGAPLQNYIPPGGQVYSIDPNGQSQFMPQDPGTVILVPVPQTGTNTEVKPPAASGTPASNTAVKPGPETAATPKPLLTPPPKEKAPPSRPKGKPTPNAGNPGTGQPNDS